jgi:hypothetical protein
MNHWATESYLSVVSDLIDDNNSTGHQINSAMMLLIGSLRSLNAQSSINEVSTRLVYYASILVQGPGSPAAHLSPQAIRAILREDTRKLRDLIVPSRKNRAESVAPGRVVNV